MQVIYIAFLQLPNLVLDYLKMKKIQQVISNVENIVNRRADQQFEHSSNKTLKISHFTLILFGRKL